MSRKSLTITLPLPPKQLSPNSRGGTKWRSSYVKKYRDNAIEALQVAVYEGGLSVDDMPWNQAEARETFYWPTRQRRDVRNAEGSMKAAYDGLVRGGLLQDDSIDHLTHLPTRFRYDKQNPRVEIEVFQVKDFEETDDG